MQTESVTPAELKTTREALGLSSEWVAEVGGVTVRSVRHWESGNGVVPDDVASILDELAAAVREHVESQLAVPAGGPVTLLRFRDQDTLRAVTGLSWPAPTRAIAQLRVVDGLRARNVAARLIWFNPDEYDRWAATAAEASPEAWAGHQPWDHQS